MTTNRRVIVLIKRLRNIKYVIMGIASKIIVCGLTQVIIHDPDPCPSIQSQHIVILLSVCTSKLLGISSNWVNKSSELITKKSIRIGGNSKLPTKVMTENPRPQLTRIGSEMSVIAICV